MSRTFSLMGKLEVIQQHTVPIQGQKPGTSGLRKKVDIFKNPDYIENFVQSVFDLKPGIKTVVIGGDGRYYMKEAILRIIDVVVANGVEKIVMPVEGILSTPAASHLIYICGAEVGFLLTASHNPGGPNGDFGIKINIGTGAPAPEEITNKIHALTLKINRYKLCKVKPWIRMDKVRWYWFHDTCRFCVIDPVDDYLHWLKKNFTFFKLHWIFQKAFIKRKQFKVLIDCMNGVTGPYAKKIIVDEIGAPKSILMNATPLPDFGGLHPDPNLIHAKYLVDRCKADPMIQFAIAFDGDGDRNMVLGKGGFFVTPGDALAVILKYHKFIIQFSYFHGVARSFPTAPAVDRVAKKMEIDCYVTPTGWKFFQNLLSRRHISLCGEESFGCGSTHCGEKDGIWTCLAWIQIMVKKDMSCKELVIEHWEEYGRDYFGRYDFEECDSEQCGKMVNELDKLFYGKTLVGKKFGPADEYEVLDTGNFEYTDKVDKKVYPLQGLYITFTNESRIVVRLSGTGSSGATVRLYLNAYSKENIHEDAQVFLKDLLEIAYTVTKLKEYTGREEPTVIT